MKKKLARILAALLIAMMLIPTVAALATTANADTTELVNLYNTDTEIQEGVPDAARYGASISAGGHRGSAPIDVAPGDIIYFGPCDPTQQWHIATYTSKNASVSQNATANRKNSSNFTKVATLDDGSVIYSYQIPSGICAVAYAHKMANYNQPTLITRNQPFGVAEYDAYINGGSGEGTETPEPPQNEFDGLLNYFTQAAGYKYDEYLRQHGNNTFVSSAYIPVTAGDSIYIAALNRDDYLKKPTKDSEHHVITTYSVIYKQLSTVMFVSLKSVETLEYGYGIYEYVIPEDVGGTEIAYIKVDVHQGIYNDGDMFVTKNQPFTGDQLRAALGIEGLSEEAKAHPFYGKKALFIGDSISYGSYDTPPTYSNPSASWARRLAQTTGLIPTNISYPGASLGKNSNCKWEYDLFKTEYISKKTYDMIVFHGGVNDARQNVDPGVALSSDTDRKTLSASDRTKTFAGGLQLMLHDARERWPEAELYYVANFKLVSDSLKGQDMNAYLTQAKILCAEYGVHYIDLFDDEVLYETFDYTSKDILSDLIHPSGPSYDLLFPTVLRLFNETIKEEENNGENNENNENNEQNPDNNGDTTITTPEVTTPVQPEQNTGDEPTEAPKPGLPLGAVIGIAVAGAVLVGGAVAGFIILKKKKLGK